MDGEQIARGRKEGAHRERPAATEYDRDVAAEDRETDAEQLPGQVVDQHAQRRPAAEAIEGPHAGGNWRSAGVVGHALSGLTRGRKGWPAPVLPSTPRMGHQAAGTATDARGAVRRRSMRRRSDRVASSIGRNSVASARLAITEPAAMRRAVVAVSVPFASAQMMTFA